MVSRRSDIILSTILLVVSALWCWGVVTTIPGAEDGSRLGARGFPLGLGLLLGGLSLVILLQSLRPVSAETAGDEAEPSDISSGVEVWAITATVGLLVGYAVLLEYTGFMIATALVVAAAVGPVLGIWRPRLIAGMSVGLSLGIYLVFGKLLGVYLPYGKLINLAF
ncbi:tripartite tricarboxylate transporter TctB family protein [Anderseniella sp. Alg231-50]|uniref:tripartite tricarboxylate transporter TctB family protein n=1 Tax=Anderseniella sp. Alg231-50 TaxID=1922226 RepID=UPI000D54DEDC